MLRRLFSFIVIIAAVLAISFWWLIRPVDSSSLKKVTIQFPRGASVAQISEILEDRNVIRSNLAFSLYVRMHGLSSKLKAGSFVFSPSMNVQDVLRVLVEGKSSTMMVLIPEGSTIADIDAILASRGLGSSGDVLRCARSCDFSSFTFLPKKTAGQASFLEGYLFPETYAVERDQYVPKFFLERMLGEFRSRIIDQYGAEIGKSGRSLHDLVIMSSLLERESRRGEERPIVAGILWKRLSGRVLLGVDATLVYGLEKGKGEHLTKTDLASDSPYNSRRFHGLPPSPIANTGESAFLAALRPKTSAYWYYLHDAQGVIHYAVTNDEHNMNRARYLR